MPWKTPSPHLDAGPPGAPADAHAKFPPRGSVYAHDKAASFPPCQPQGGYTQDAIETRSHEAGGDMTRDEIAPTQACNQVAGSDFKAGTIGCEAGKEGGLMRHRGRSASPGVLRRQPKPGRRPTVQIQAFTRAFVIPNLPSERVNYSRADGNMIC